MAVRLRARGRSGRVVETMALLDSGFKAPTPQLLIPAGIARSLDLWPPEGAF